MMRQLGNYQLVRLLGRGSFAEVYLGKHLHLDTYAAVKVLSTQLATPEDREDFEKEARTIAHLKYRNIVSILDYDVEEDTPFLVMDYAPGGTLRQRHPQGTILPLTTIISYVHQIASALQYAHNQRVIHRDIKPENILIGQHNELLLSDFGLAIAAQSSHYQETQNMGGTLAYIAPEQIRGKPRPASDQYSLGIVVYEWLSGGCPFHGSMMEMVTQHLAVSPPSLREKDPTLSLDVEQVVLTALAKDPKQRFASIQAFATALEEACQPVQPFPADSSVVASPLSHSSQPSVAAPSARQPSSPPDIVAADLPEPSPLPTNVVIPKIQSAQSTHVVAPLSQSLQPTNVVTPSSSLSQPTVADTPNHVSTVSPSSVEKTTPPGGLQPSKHRISRRALVVGLAALAVTGGSVTWLALRQSSSRPAKTSVPTTRPRPTPTPTPIPLGTTFLTYSGHSSSVRSVAWSPDGRRIASGADDPDNTVQVWDAVTGQTILTYRGNLISTLATKKNPSADNGFMDFVGWLPDSKRIVSEFFWQPGVSNSDLYSYNTVQMWDAMSGQTIWAHTESGNANTNTPLAKYWNAMALSPDGTRIAVAYSVTTSSNVARVLQIWNATTGTILSSKDISDLVSEAAWSPDGTHIALAINLDVQVWDVATWNIAFTYHGHSQAKYNVTAMAWSPDSKHIASVADDNIVRVWDAITGNTILIYSGYSQSKSNVTAMAWSPGKKRIASADGSSVQIWDATTGNQIYTLNSQVDAVAWSSDGTRIVSAGDKVQVWQAV